MLLKKRKSAKQIENSVKMFNFVPPEHNKYENSKKSYTDASFRECLEIS